MSSVPPLNFFLFLSLSSPSPFPPVAREEEQARNRQAEEENWTKALTGELSGRRKAAIGAVQGMDGTQQLLEDITDKEGDLLTTMFKGKQFSLVHWCYHHYTTTV